MMAMMAMMVAAMRTTMKMMLMLAFCPAAAASMMPWQLASEGPALRPLLQGLQGGRAQQPWPWQLRVRCPQLPAPALLQRL